MAVTATTILEKQPSEKRIFTMNFANLMNSDETISSITSITSETRGGDTSDLTISGETISGQNVVFFIEGGTSCLTYRIECIIVTSAGQILEGDGLLEVQDK